MSQIRALAPIAGALVLFEASHTSQIMTAGQMTVVPDNHLMRKHVYPRKP